VIAILEYLRGVRLIWMSIWTCTRGNDFIARMIDNKESWCEGQGNEAWAARLYVSQAVRLSRLVLFKCCVLDIVIGRWCIRLDEKLLWAAVVLKHVRDSEFHS